MRWPAAALALLALAGCGGSGSGEAAAPRLTVLAAASLTEVLPPLDPSPRYSFGGSNQLALQLREGAPADVFLSASPRYTQELHEAGLVDEPRAFATNSLVLVVPRANPAGIRAVEDLRRPRIRLVTAGPDVPIGAYTREVLERLGAEDVLDRVVSVEPDVKAIVGKVALGEADAGFVYATDARPVAERVSVLELPARAQPTVRYEAAVVRASERQEAARAFVDRLLAPAGRDALAAAGFGLP